MKKDDIKTLIVVVLVCVICIALILFFGMKKNIDKLKPVTQYSMYFSVSNFINLYLHEASEENSIVVYNMLDSEYIESNDINSGNINFKLLEKASDPNFIISNMDYLKINNNYMYVIEGSIVENTLDKQIVLDDHYNLIVLSDLDNYTMSIYPINEKNKKNIINKIKKIKIDKNDNNQLQPTGIIDKERICSLYLSDYVNMLFDDISNAYSLLDKDMKEKYPNVNSFELYIKNNISNITTSADTCSKNELENSRIYTVLDKNKNKFIFKEKSIMNYEVEFYLYEKSALND